jgi:hypothetical protein
MGHMVKSVVASCKFFLWINTKTRHQNFPKTFSSLSPNVYQIRCWLQATEIQMNERTLISTKQINIVKFIFMQVKSSYITIDGQSASLSWCKALIVPFFL